MSKIVFLVATSLLALTVATAAEAQAPEVPINLHVSRAELQVIGQGVMKLPYEVAAPVMKSLQDQLTVIEAAAAKTADDAKAPDKAKSASKK